MTDNKAVMQQALESLIESARLLGATQEKRSWTGYTKTDSMFESACYEIIEAKKQTILEAIAQPVGPAVATDAEVGLLVYRGNSVAYIYQKMQSYSNCLSDSWKAMTEIGKGSDGKTDLPSAIRKLQTQAVEPATVNFEVTGHHIEVLATMLHCVPTGESELFKDLNDFCHDARTAFNKAKIAHPVPLSVLHTRKAELVWAIAQDKWNALADKGNQWNALGQDEMSLLIVRETELQLSQVIAQPVESATQHNFCPHCGKRLGGIDDIHTCTAPAHLNLSKKTVEKLHKFLDASAGDGVISDGVDAADLYIEIFPEQYAESAK